MARGWESKDVESQQDLAEQREREKERPQLTMEQKQRKSRRDILMLDQTRLLRDLEQARHPRHQEQIRAALAHIATKLQELGEPLG